jgi:hypothetical protein
VAILSHPISWRRAAQRDVQADLTPEEQENVKEALRFLSKRHGSTGKLAEAMGVTRARVLEASSRARGVTAGLALKASRVAKVPLETILSGAWPKPTACPHCGRE